MHQFLFKLLVCVLVLSSQSLVSKAMAEPNNVSNFIFSDVYYLNKADNPDFAQPVLQRDLQDDLQSDQQSDLKHTGWRKYSFNGLPSTKQIVWVQVDFTLEDDYQAPLGLLVNVLGSFEAYWDGQLLAKNGVVGDSIESEIPGRIDHISLLPQHLATKGKHTLSLRISMQHNPSYLEQVSFVAILADYDFLLQVPFKRASLPLIMTSALLLVALYSLVIFATSQRKISYLLFGLLCLSILTLIFAESWRGLMPYTYDWQIPRLQIILALSCLISILLTAFFAWFFDLSKTARLSWLGLACLLQLAIVLFVNGYDNRSLFVFLVGIASAMSICIQAIIKRQINAKLMLVGLVLFTAPIFINSFSYMDQYFFLSFSALIGLMLYTLAHSMKLKQQALVQSQINAGRLELELVKRNLQPHFILNTLTAIEEWIEDSPATAVKFIHALADEFRFMAQMSSQTIISLREELSLCEAHLKVMGYRTNTTFSMHSNMLNADAVIPPGVILTLLENAISHNHYQQGDIVFSLAQTLTETSQTILFIAPVVNHMKNKQAKNGHLKDAKHIGAGLGNQYIQARLNESFGDQHSLSERLSEDQWQVTITMPLTSKRPPLEGAPRQKTGLAK